MPPSCAIATENEILVRVDGCAKNSPSVRPGRRGFPVDLELGGEVEHRLGLGGDEVGDPQQVATGQRDGERRLHDHRSFAAATADPTSIPRSRGRRPPAAAKIPARTCGDLLVGVAEGHALADERLGGVGRPQLRVGAGGGEPLAVELEPA